MSSSSDKCTNCAKLCIDGQNCIQCDKCDCWLHLKCSGLKLKEFKKVGKETEFIIIMLRRSVLSDNGREIVLNKDNAGDNICIR